MLKILITIGLLIVSNQTFANSKCEREWNDLKSIQTQMRHKSTEYLRNKERDKHKEYQNCRKGKKKKSKKYKTKANYNKQSTNNTYRKYTSNTITNTVSLKGKFNGDKQDAWVKYYDKPQECVEPKDISQFSRCLKYRDEKARDFDREWNSKPE